MSSCPNCEKTGLIHTNTCVCHKEVTMCVDCYNKYKCYVCDKLDCANCFTVVLCPNAKESTECSRHSVMMPTVKVVGIHAVGAYICSKCSTNRFLEYRCNNCSQMHPLYSSGEEELPTVRINKRLAEIEKQMTYLCNEKDDLIKQYINLTKK